MHRMLLNIQRLLLVLFLCVSPVAVSAQAIQPGAQGVVSDPFVAQMKVEGMLVPGTVEFLKDSITQAEEEGAVALVIEIDTPGGMLQSTQQLVQQIFKASIPIIVYVSPSGATAASAGVFFTEAGHIAAMAPGTTMGAAHPVMMGPTGSDKNQQIMLEKAESIAMAMARSIAEQRGRNVDWIEKAVKDSESITANEALELGAIDVIAQDIPDLLEQIAGTEVVVNKKKRTLQDYSLLPRRVYTMTSRTYLLTLLSNPILLGLLWLGAVTGIGLELRAPGGLVPGVVGALCLILALIVSQTIPVSYGGIVLLILGGVLIVAETFVGTGILAFGGLLSMGLGLFYLVDVNEAPGMQIGFDFIIPILLASGTFFLYVVRVIVMDRVPEGATGDQGMVGLTGRVVHPVSESGKVFVNGEYWNARLDDGVQGVIEKDVSIRVTRVVDGMRLIVERLEETDHDSE